MEIIGIIASLLFANLVLLIWLGFAISNLRNKIEFEVEGVNNRLGMVQERMIREFEEDLNRHHDAVMNSIADMYKDIVRREDQEGNK